MSNIMDKIIIDAPSKKLEDAMRNKIERYVKEQEQADDLKELEKRLNNYQDNTHGVVGQWQDYYEEGTDNLMDKYRDVGMSPSDFISEG